MVKILFVHIAEKMFCRENMYSLIHSGKTEKLNETISLITTSVTKCCQRYYSTEWSQMIQSIVRVKLQKSNFLILKILRVTQIAVGNVNRKSHILCNHKHFIDNFSKNDGSAVNESAPSTFQQAILGRGNYNSAHFTCNATSVNL